MLNLRLRCFGRFKRFFSSSTVTFHKFTHELLQVSDEIQEAVTSKRAVVALESTIITHGMPYPHNLRTALSVEKKVRESGAVPATVAVLNGKICVGLNEDNLLWLAEKNSALVKVSRRDLSYVLSQGLSGGTTVSATMIAAHIAGIPIFATGGIGGVHRGAEATFDVSADLTELGRTPVAVVSSGVKSILDIPKTLEYLETQGTCVVTYGQSKSFPAFFTRDSGCFAPHNAATSLEAAKMIDTHLRIGLHSGMLIAVPVPGEFAAAGELIQQAINEAVESARKNNIIGKEVTPYILNMVSELTEGQSLGSNIALVENNASVAGEIACCLSMLRKGASPNNTEFPSQGSAQAWLSSPTAESTQPTSGALCKNLLGVSSPGPEGGQKDGSLLPGRPVVIGASVVDFSVQIEDPSLKFNGATYKGRVRQSFGGVGRNLADGLSRLDCNPVFISALGMDSLANASLQYCNHIDMHLVQRLHDVPTASYCPVLVNSGQLLFGVGDMDINSHFTLSKVSDLDLIIKSAPLVILDGNFSTQVIEEAVLKCAESAVPVWFEPTDLFKSIKPFQTDAWRHLSFISPNLGELVCIHRALREKLDLNVSNIDVPDDSSRLEDIVKLSAQMCIDIVPHIPVVLVTLGKHGVLLGHSFDDTSHLLPLPSCRRDRKQFRAMYYRALNSDMEQSKIVSVSGAGDCLAAAFIAGMLQGLDVDECVKRGLLAASLSLQSTFAVPESVSVKSVVSADTASVFANWCPVDVSDGQADLL